VTRAAESGRGRGGGHLERHAEATPDAPALGDEHRVLTFAEWNALANQLADALAGRGVQAGDRVGVRTTNRIEWFVVDAALSKLGAVRVAIAWRLRPGEVRYILESSGARAVFFDDEDVEALSSAFATDAGERLPGLGLLVGFSPTPAPGVTPYPELIASGRATPRHSGKASEAIIYTSGTTGRPKGVQRARPADDERRAAFQALNEDLKRAIPYRPGDRNLLCAPLNHAAAPSSALATHSRGGTVFVLRKFDPEEALRWIERHRISVSFMVPTMLNRIVNLPEGVRARYDVSSVRIITTGASVCPADLKSKVTAYLGPCIYESYGSTETGVITILTPEDQVRHADSCGRLLAGVQVRIVDDEGRVLPAGGVGQIFIKSPVTIGAYVGESALGADVEQDGYFTAGDVGRLDDEGFLYILDRKKDMIISGGVNIYPAEIEEALRAHPAVLDAAVFGVPHTDLGEEVRAVCERVPGKEVADVELLAFVKDRLASFKRPRAIEFTDELPRNAAGKVLKRELRAPHWAGTGRVI
jgi:long-chain acyl-CoA synthetase